MIQTYIFVLVSRYYFRTTIKEFLLFHMKFRKLRFNITELLNIFKLEKYIDTKIENLSSGTIQKIKLMITFYSDSDFILLDEPTTI